MGTERLTAHAAHEALTPPAIDATAPRDDQPKTEHTEIGGPSGPEPTRFGDWERRGRCIDF